VDAISSLRSEIPPYNEAFLSLNHLQDLGFERWAFRPGMLFGSKEQWWGRGGQRKAAHEGIDLKTYLTDKDALLQLDDRILVPSIASGKIVSISDDFIGRSIFMEHPNITMADKRLITLFGHTRPSASANVGSHLEEHSILGTIAKPRSSRSTSHLHVSIAWIAKGIAASKLDWEMISKGDGVELLDPLAVMLLPNSVSSD
jgi:hypothetical protein